LLHPEVVKQSDNDRNGSKAAIPLWQLWVESGHCSANVSSMLHKRDLSGTVVVDGREFEWELRREPQWCTADGWQGMLVGVSLIGAVGKEALLQFPPAKKAAQGARAYRHRPQVQRADLENGIMSALAAGWEPEERGKPFHVEL
jgi:hypothetical protein